ncbi:MAG: thioredoxin family protein [Methanobacteriota archaeon]
MGDSFLWGRSDVHGLSCPELHERAASDGPLLAVYYADWCGYCERFAGPWNALYPQVRVPVVYRDISDEEEDPCWEDRSAIRVVPTLVLWRAGSVAARLDGVLGRGIDPARLREWLAGNGLLG